MLLALDGSTDRRVVNFIDDALLSISELVALACGSMAASAAPLANIWNVQADGTLARSLGFQAVVRTIHQAAVQGLL